MLSPPAPGELSVTVSRRWVALVRYCPTITCVSSAVSQAGQGNEFAVPDVADTEAGAKFFAQHALDLAWAVGQEFIAREYESFTELVVEGIQKADWSNNDAKLAEASLLFTKSMKHRAERVRDIADQNHPVIFETMLCRYVDNFLSYVADLLGVIMVLNPRALANRDSTISLKDVLNHDTMESLHEWLVDRKVNDLTFQGFGRIVEYYKTKFDFILVTDQNIERTITMAVATRNLLVHKEV